MMHVDDVYNEAQLEKFVAERDDACRRLDESWIKRQFPTMSPEARLITLHKIRYSSPTIEAALRHESGEWLRDRGYNAMGGEPLRPRGELPE